MAKAEHAPSLLIALDPPVKFGEKSYDAVELREPKAGEVLKAQAELGGSANDTMKYGIVLTSIVSGIPRGAVEQMPISKLLKGVNYLMDFFDFGPVTGNS